MRKTPPEPPKQIETPSLPAGMVRQERHYRLITPLFGGGVEPGVADPLTVIRGTTIRGQLRFWWRATRGGAFGAVLAKMKAAEALIWGAASDEHGAGPSKVQIEVRITAEGHDFEVRNNNGQKQYDQQNNPLNVGSPRSPYSYGAFPLNSRNGATIRDGVRFTLILTFQDDPDPKESIRKDIEAALWAWETLGGIGGRTRRGFGALAFDGGMETCAAQPRQTIPVSQPEATKQAVEEWIVFGLSEHVVDGVWPQDVPHLTRQLRFKPTNQADTADNTWKHLLERLKDFRQQRKKEPRQTQRGSSQVPARNHWPEPDAIRALTGQACNYTDNYGNLHDHTSPICQVNGQPVKKFPRAAFGLPIIFQFKEPDRQEGDPPGRNIPGQYTLTAKQPESDNGYERFASPLILRSLECRGGKTIGLALLLEGTQLPAPLYLIEEQVIPHQQRRKRLIGRVEATMDRAEALTVTNVRNNQRLLTPGPSGESPDDILLDFLKFL